MYTPLSQQDPQTVEDNYRKGLLNTEQARRYVVSKKIRDGDYLDLTPDDAEYALRTNLLTKDDARKYIEYKKNPVWFYFKDALQGIPYGVQEAVNEITNTSAELINWVGGSELDTKSDVVDVVDSPDTIAGGLTSGITQFSTAFIPYVGAVGKFGKIGAIAEQYPAVAKFLTGMVAGAMADATAFDPYAGRLSDLVERYPELSNPISDYLKTDPTDSSGEARLKSALEGVVLGVAAEGLLHGLKLAKAKIWKNNFNDAERVAEDLKKNLKTARKERPHRGKQVDSIEVLERPVKKNVDTSRVDWIRDDAEIRNDLEVAANVYGEDAQARAREAVRRIISKEPPEGAEKRPVNYDKLTEDTPPEVLVKAIQDMSDVNAERTAKLRGGDAEGVRSIAEQERAAARLMKGILNPEEAVQWMTNVFRGTQHLEESIIVMRNIIKGFSDNILQSIPRAQTPADKLKVLQKIQYLQEMLSLKAGVKTHTGRSTAAWRHVAEGVRFNFDSLKGSELEAFYRNEQEGIDAVLKSFAEATKIEDRLNVVKEYGKKGLLDKMLMWRQAMLVANATTPAVNVISNATATAIEEINHTLALTVDGFRHMDAARLNQLMSRWYGYVDGFSASLRLPWATQKHLISGDWKTYLQEMGNMENWGRAWRALFTGEASLDWVKKFDGSPGSKGLFSLGNLISLPFRPLAFGDEMFKNLGYHARLRELAFQEGYYVRGLRGEELTGFINDLVARPTKTFHYEALKLGRRITFTEPLGPVATEFSRLINSAGRGGTLFRIFFMPFYRVLVGISKFAVENSIFGLATKRFMDGIKAGGVQAAEAWARIASGTALMITGIMLQQAGIMTGRRDSSEGKAWDNAGVQPYSIKGSDGVYYSINRYDPISTIIGWGANIGQLNDWYKVGDKEFDKLVGLALAGTVSAALEKSWFKSASDFVKIVTDPDRMNLARWANQTAVSFIPGAIEGKQIQQHVDPVLREADTMMETLLNSFHSKGLRPRRHPVYGTPIARLAPTMYGAARRKLTDDPVLKEMLRLKMNVGGIGKKLTVRGVTIDLTPEQIDRVEQAYARYPIKERLTSIITDPRYAALPDYQKKAMLNRNLSKFRSRARKKALNFDKEVGLALELERRRLQRVGGFIEYMEETK